MIKQEKKTDNQLSQKLDSDIKTITYRFRD